MLTASDCAPHAPLPWLSRWALCLSLWGSGPGHSAGGGVLSQGPAESALEDGTERELCGYRELQQ